MTLTNYWFLLVWLLFPGLILKKLQYREGKNPTKSVFGSWGLLSAWILAIPYVIWTAFRPDSMGDTGAYHKIISYAPTAINEWPSYLAEVSKDKGFSVLILAINLIAKNAHIFIFFVLALIQMAGIVHLFRKYSSDYWMSMFIFIATTDYISWMHNGIRQFTAVTIILFASEYILNKEYMKAIIVILLASTMHQSALIMIPIIFIVQGKAWNKKTLLCVLGAIAALMFVDQFTDILEIVLSDTQYTNVVTDWNEFNDDGTNPIRVLFYSLPTLLSLIGMKHIHYENSPIINLCVNMSIVSTAIYIVSMGTSGIFIGRLPIYTSI